MSLSAEYTTTLDFSAAAVWALAGAFDGLPAICSGAMTSSLVDGGRVRVLALTGGAVLWERLLSFDECAMTLAYEIVDTKGFSGQPYGVGYRGRISVTKTGDDRAVFGYSAEFEPTPGWEAATACKAIQEFAQDCATGIARRLKSAQHCSRLVPGGAALHSNGAQQLGSGCAPTGI
jgi:hypothetical protein